MPTALHGSPHFVNPHEKTFSLFFQVYQDNSTARSKFGMVTFLVKTANIHCIYFFLQKIYAKSVLIVIMESIILPCRL